MKTALGCVFRLRSWRTNSSRSHITHQATPQPGPSQPSAAHYRGKHKMLVYVRIVLYKNSHKYYKCNVLTLTTTNELICCSRRCCQGNYKIFMCYSWVRLGGERSRSGHFLWLWHLARNLRSLKSESENVNFSLQTPSPAMSRMGWALRTLLVADNSSCLKDRKVSVLSPPLWC